MTAVQLTLDDYLASLRRAGGLRIQTRDGWREVKKFKRIGQVAVHKTYFEKGQDPEEGYTITHVLSGLAVIHTSRFVSQGWAIRFAEILREIDLDKFYRDGCTDPLMGERFRQAVRKWRETIFPRFGKDEA